MILCRVTDIEAFSRPTCAEIVLGILFMLRHTSPIIGNFQALGFVLDEIARSIVYKVAGDIHIAFIRRQVSDMLVDFFQFIGIFIIGVFSPQPFLALVVVYNNLGS